MRIVVIIFIVGFNLLFGKFIRNGEIIENTRTKEIWQDNEVPLKMTWADAKKYCSSLDLNGIGWRLPTKEELNSIVNLKSFNPSIFKEFKNFKSSLYWTNESYSYDNNFAWSIDFYYGYSFYKYKNNRQYVRCIK